MPRQSRRYQFVTETPGNALREAFETGDGESQTATVPIPSERLHTIETHVDNLNQMVQALQAQRHPDNRQLGAQRSTNGQDVALSEIPALQSMHSTCYVELACLTSMCDEVAELGEVLSNQARYLLGSEQASTVSAESEPEYQADFDSRRPSMTQAHSSAPSSLQTSTGPQLTPLNPMAPTASNVPWDASSDVVMDPTGIDWAYFDHILQQNGFQMPDQASQR
ncbi:hypothetical protein DOTSEDRAFT_53286 [Dothistroma septosporum NZE10]|uniref:Uncharacterized protein n=1 Tax=Dothistroma septosporum (strain NZE10 / CBS 128990) TaxID=675120 RepID=N1PKR4_DOTSN|nr:hypothetical protein DOTSEDRAFT_53286 [Dothistroma septosporum NZE10]